MGIYGDIDESLIYVLEVDDNQQPKSTAKVSHTTAVRLKYLVLEPGEHITFGANALLGRMLRAVNWETEREAVKGHTEQISASLAANLSVNAL
ncbi:hypothetical protein [Vibrio anguillarum]|uniref:hypothetical protein n=1 Tax=Vibrio anguillarum TaxID=55601 RepID=UPI00038F29E0|nr:hypothetical protein [Vibrio anguillarum]AGU58997.1 hypothetical protein N175_13140 [Vibrio anguillarum M3]